MPDIQANAPDRLKAWRKASGRSQASLADDLGVTRQTVIEWEKGVPPSLDNASALERLTGIPASAFAKAQEVA